MNFLSSPVNRAIVIGAIAVVIGLFFYFADVQGTLTQYQQSTARLQQDETTYNSLKAVADQKPQYLALTKQIQVQLASVKITADPRAYIPSYLKQIEDLAKTDGLQVTSVTPQAAPTPTPGPSSAPAVNGAAPVPGAIANTGPTQAATRALGAESAQSAVTQGVAQQTGGAPANASGAASAGGATMTRGGTAVPTSAGAPGSARANAIAYLNQSFEQVPINMELSGTYTQFEKFLHDLNKFPKLIGVGNVTMTPGANSSVGETPTLNIILPIVAYRLSPSSGVAPASQAPGGSGG